MFKRIFLIASMLFSTLGFSSNSIVNATWSLDMTSTGFTIDTSDFAPGWTKVEWDTAEQKINSALWIIIQKLMIAMWMLSLLIMTVWAWYMILYRWQDELLSKWKSIFSSGLIALVVALSSYYLVSLVRFILYSNGS